MAKMISLGADQIAHLPYDRMSDELIAETVTRRIPVMPTFSVYRGLYVRVDILMNNFRRLYEAGGVIAFGDDFAGGPGPFELGMPMYELEKMAASGMKPMDVIRSCTSVAAAACGIGDLVGTVRAGKKADLLAVRASPLQDLSALLNVRLVMRNGSVINWGE
jgi:imidazolonepropionase-like amidohydrolase